MKKLLTALICVSLICAGFLTSCKKEEPVEEKKVEQQVVEQIPEVDPIPFEYELSKGKGTAVITSYTGDDAVVTVPAVISAVVDVELTKEEIEALPKTEETQNKTRKSTKTPTKKAIREFEVKGIESGAFFGNETVESVIVEEGIETIGEAAFQNCKAMKSIKLPESLISIGTRAFYGCEELCELNIGPKVESIGYMAFSDIFFEIPWYSALKDTAVIVGDGVLLKYNSTSDVVFGDEVKHVAYYAFADNSVANVTFSGALETVDSKAFFESKPTVYVPADCAAIKDLTAANVNYITDEPQAQ